MLCSLIKDAGSIHLLWSRNRAPACIGPACLSEKDTYCKGNSKDCHARPRRAQNFKPRQRETMPMNPTA